MLQARALQHVFLAWKTLTLRLCLSSTLFLSHFDLSVWPLLQWLCLIRFLLLLLLVILRKRYAQLQSEDSGRCELSVLLDLLKYPL